MKRPKLLPLLAILLALAALFYILIGLYLPTARRITLGVDKHSGRIRIVQNQITFLPWHRFYRLSFDRRNGAAQTNGLIRITSSEGVPVKINYRLRFGFTARKLPDAKTLVRDGWSAWLRTRVAEAVSAVTAKIPIEEFATPNALFSRQRDLLRQTVAKHLAQSGLTVTAFEIEQIDIDRDALLRYKRAELRRNARSAVGRVAVIGIDGADWELLTELMIDGRLPNIKALVDGGASGTLSSIQPTVSSLVWTTMATGVPPYRHGVLDFFDRATNSPVDSRARTAPAVWEIAESFGRTVEVSDWWAAWPPQTAGTFVSTPVQLLPGGALPKEIASKTAGAVVPEETIGAQQLARFLNLTASEFEKSLTEHDEKDPAIVFRHLLAKTWSDHRRALQGYQLTKPTVMMLMYEGTDAVNHLFGPYHPPYREGVSETEYRKYWKSVTEYYAEIDRLIGEWMHVLPADSTVILVSAHGMRWGKDRPKTPPREEPALADHRSTGIFVAYGQGVLPSRLRRPLSIYDITPTLLALIGLPSAQEMPGKPVTWAFKDLQPVTTVPMTSYQDLVIRKNAPTDAMVDGRFYRTMLQDIGHLLDPDKPLTPILEESGSETATAKPLSPDKWGTYAYLNNLAIALKKQKKYQEAGEALQRAIDLNPARPTPYLNYAMLLLERQQYTAAEDVFLKAVSLGLPTPDRYLVDFASWYRQHDMATRAINLLLRGKQLFPQSYLISANLGSALCDAKRYTDGEVELQRALSIQPSSTQVLNNLGILYAKRNDYGRALDLWNRSLAIDPRQPAIRDAVTAARTRL